MASDSALFPRNFRKKYPIAVRGEGCWIIDESGRRYLDASAQAAVVNIGHGVAEIGRAMEDGLKAYAAAVRGGNFPTSANAASIDSETVAAALAMAERD